MQLFESRSEYQEQQMPLQHFRPKIYQEERRLKFNRYRREVHEPKLLQADTEVQFKAQLKETMKKKKEQAEKEKELQKKQPLHPLA